MSTKKQTNTVQTNTYDKGSMNAFKGFTNQVSGFTGQWLGPDGKAGPTSTPGFNLNYQANLNNANAINGRNVRNISANALALGANPNSAATQAILARAGRGASGMQANAFMNAYQNSVQQQNMAAQMAGSYKPLQTGGTQNTIETTGGLGTWLPQVVGAGLGMATGFMSGGASAFGKASPSSLGSVAPSSYAGAMAGGGFGAGIGYNPNSFGGYR